MTATTTCPRCGGAGGWEGWPGFTCYLCHGKGRVAAKRAPKRKVFIEWFCECGQRNGTVAGYARLCCRCLVDHGIQAPANVA